jgi:glycosyltransferase involved in cell wall biosynthesis
MKILMLNYEYPPLGGGAANANKHIIEQMADRNDLEVDLVTSSEDGYEVEQFSDNINIYKLDVKKDEIHHWTQIEVLRYMFKGLLKSRKLEKKNDYDMIHAWFGFPCGFMARILRKPYLVALRGSDVPGYNERFGIQYIFLKPIIKNVWKKAGKIVPNSNGLKQLAKETLDIDMQVIPNGIDTDKFQPANNEEEGNGDESEKKLKLLCVSRLTPRKRINDIMEAIQDLDVELTVIGQGDQEEELKEKMAELGIEEKMEFMGYVPHEQLPEKYREADIFVMPSLNEGMSNTILEAISSGLPIITTQVGGTDELIDENGHIVDKKSPKQIKEAIKDYMKNPEKLERHRKKSRNIAETMSWERVTEEYIEAYREIS